MRTTSVHRHPEVIELVYVLRGELSVRVSSERFVLEEGDYALLNAGDMHVFEGGEDTLIAVLQLELAAFLPGFPQLHGAIFACESFDLPRYLGTETSQREQLLAIFCAEPAARIPLVERLLGEMLDSYGVEHYYDRRRTLNQSRRSLIRAVTALLREHAAERNVLDLVSEQLHYSKSALSRIARESTGMSFSDLLTNVRLWRAEVLLLETEDTMVSIAAACGFSDVKYFTRAFRSWFACTPSQYRRENLDRLRGQESVEPLAAFPVEVCAGHLRGELPSGRPVRRSVTPIDVVTIAAERDTFVEAASSTTLASLMPTGASPEAPSARMLPHLLPIRADAEGFRHADWQHMLRLADRDLYRPVLIVSATRAVEARAVAEQLRALAIADVDLWVSYRFGDEHLAEHLSRELADHHGVTAVPMLTG
ncbi:MULTISPECIES: AraC family transcriptional regulator [unclassified Leucobacter]|uniref:helix-turn-helix domain-containing protein n=2 Tax=Leucobacter TaxID=55968 RepID=UPI00165DE0D6|nr:helix-turn-helix domain-containing protein [Leucobacter sp. cx-87]